MKNYLKLLKFLAHYKKKFGLAVVVMFISRIFEGFQMSLIVPVMDRIFTKKPIILPNKLPPAVENIINWLNSIEPETMFMALPMVVLVVIILKNAIIYVYSFLMNDISQLIMRDVRFQLYAKIQSFSLDYFSKKRTGELLSRVTHDVQVVENAVSYSVTDLFVQSFTIIMYVTIAFTIHLKAAVLIFFVFPFIVWPITLIGKKLRKLSRSTQERMADINTILLETISGVRVVKAFCTEAFEIGRFRAKNHDFYKLRMKAVRRNLLIAPITEVFSVIFGVLIIFWLGRQVMDDKLSSGVFFLFFASVMSIISPMKKLGNVHTMVQQALAANERIYDILDKEPTVQEKPDAVHLATIRKGVDLNNVSFRYDSESDLVLKNINLSIKVGELVAIVGPTGTGKSTLANLIPRFYDPVEGEVTLDGVNLKDVSFLSLRQQIGIVAQETFLFNDTVRNNIAYGTPNATQADIETAAKRAYAHRFIIEMPQGYETIVGDRGFRLSGGEKQRIAIARAILRNPPILILDEATSQLDSESEKFVQEALDQLMQGRTVIAIAHRLSTIMKAQKIVVLDQGQIVGLGPHAEILKTCGLYKRLYETQFQI
ncbi:MAG TPA: ABC transporter ATP-binding protein [Candidatus Omnitrophota bacterium]|nr:ABC transporter ATP-binding protein [Candidatus Omnitrophota bacterium]